jgi:hypothetical protein
VLRSARPDVAEYLELEGVRLKERMQAVTQELSASGDRLLLVLGGFDNVLADAGITRAIWDNLRSLARQPVLRYVTGSRRPLRELCRTEESRTSDFWEIFSGAPIVVGALRTEERDEVLRSFEEKAVSIEAAASRFSSARCFSRCMSRPRRAERLASTRSTVSASRCSPSEASCSAGSGTICRPR